MKAKRVLFLFLVLTMVTYCAACGQAPAQTTQTEPQAPSPTKEQAAPSEPTTAPEPDKPNPVQDDGVKKMGISYYTSEIPSLNMIVKGARTKAEELGYTVYLAEAGFDNGKQLKNVEDFITMGCNVLLINPVDSAGVVPAIEAANRAGVPVIMLDIDAEGGVRAAHVTSDNEKMGRYGAEYLAWKLNGNGEVALFDYPQLDIVKDRSDAFRKVLESFTDLKLVAEDQAVKRDESLPKMEAMLQAHPNIKGVYAINGGAGFGAYYASVAAGKDVIVAAGDGEAEGIELVRTGTNYQLDTSHFATILGQLASITADKILKGESIQYKTVNPVYPVTLGSIEHYPGIDSPTLPDAQYLEPSWYSDPGWIALCEKYSYTGWKNQ